MRNDTIMYKMMIELSKEDWAEFKEHMRNMLGPVGERLNREIFTVDPTHWWNGE